MDESDPFGRDKDEDPLAEMGWSRASTPAAPETGAAEIAPPERADHAARRTAAPPSRHRPFDPKLTSSGGIPGQGTRASRTGCLFAIVVLAMIGGIGAAAVPAILDAIDTVEEEIDKVTPTVPDVPDVGGGGGGGGGREREARPPAGLEQRSMLRRGNLAPALRRLERITRSSRVRLVGIDAEKVIVQTAASGGRTRLAQATWQGEASVLSTSPGGNGTTFSWSQVDASAPNLVARGATRGRRSSSFDYLVLIDAAGLRWSAFLKNGAGTYQAEPDGGGLRKIG